MSLVPHKDDPDYKVYKKGGLEAVAKKRNTSPERSLPKNTTTTTPPKDDDTGGGKGGKE